MPTCFSNFQYDIVKSIAQLILFLVGERDDFLRQYLQKACMDTNLVRDGRLFNAWASLESKCGNLGETNLSLIFVQSLEMRQNSPVIG